MKAIVERLDSRQKDLKQQERKRMGDMTIEKLQSEAAQLEVELRRCRSSWKLADNFWILMISRSFCKTMLVLKL
ncbi:hypothetical protein LINPERPRIM_LOCUS29602 [Linum perenne]